MTPELSRPVLLARLPPESVVEAGPEECARLAERMGVPAVHSLRCTFALAREGAAVTARGVLEAEVVQTCVVSLEPLTQRVAERFALRFVPAGSEGDDDDPDSPDEIPYSGPAIDLGEAAAEQLALALDPYPRNPLAELEAGDADEDAPLLGAALRLRE